MTCPRCRQDNPPHARFCPECGARLALTCGACGAELPRGAHFCLQCGQAVAAGTAAAGGSAAPETYTPKHLAEKILTSKAALEGERKQVTVLFADLKGSMELLADRDPEEARKLLDPVLERMMEAVHRYEGTVNQVMGDGIMALFGAPARPRGPRRAGLLRGAPDAGEREDVRGGGAPLARRAVVKIRVGLNSGRGRRARHRQRSPHGLHGRRPDDAPGRADGAARRSRRDRDHARDAGAGRRLRRGEVARPRAGEGARRAGGGLRGDGSGPGADPPAGGRPARADALRRPRRRAGAAPPRPAARRRRSRPGGGDRRRGGGGQVAPRLRVHPLASPAGLAGPRERLGLVRQGDELPAGDRPPQGLLQDPGPGRPPRDPREGDGQAAHPGPTPWSRRCRRCWPCSTCPWTTPRGRRSTRRSAASARSTP